MDGVKVTYIETQFVTSDAAGFKDLVQRLTGRSPAAASAAAPAPAAVHRPGACRASAAGQQGYYYRASSPAARAGDGRLAPPCLDEARGAGDFSGLLHGSASQDAQCYYSDFYFPC